MAVANKDGRIFLRATSRRKEIWRQFAEEDGRTLSDWLRWLADRRVAECSVEANTPGR
jgi:hypothetical protein